MGAGAGSLLAITVVLIVRDPGKAVIVPRARRGPVDMK
jgi:hypothetical protein